MNTSRTRLIISEGDKYGHFTVIGEAERVKLPSGQTNRMILCKCVCGAEKAVRLSHLTREKIRSCGCVTGHESHGKSKSLLYNVWRGMKNRCFSSSYIDWHLYGGKGVTVCSEWSRSFSVFEKWATENAWQHGLHLDRINSDGNYEPANCRFVTPLTNACNISTNIIVNYNGAEQPLRTAVDNAGKSDDYHTIRNRYKKGWTVERAIDTPIRDGNYVRGKGSRS